MYKILLFIPFITIVVAAPGQDQAVSTYQSTECLSNSSFNVEFFIDLNRQKNDQNIQNYDTQMEMFRQKYNVQVDTLNTTLKMMLTTVAHTKERLKFLDFLSEQTKSCGDKYLSLLPVVDQTKAVINACRKTAKDQLNNLLNTPLANRNYLNTYYKTIFENGISKCKKQYNSFDTMCVLKVVSDGNTYTFNNQKAFDMAMAASECAAKLNIEKAFVCGFTAQNHTIAMNFEVNTLTDNCLLGQNYCAQYNQSCYSCTNVYNMKVSAVNYNSKTMDNVFYGRNDLKNCLMLKMN